MTNGDVKSALRDLPAIKSAASESLRTVSDMAGIIESADMRAYLESGAFYSPSGHRTRPRQVDEEGRVRWGGHVVKPSVARRAG
jgi:hypothetical protein